jgi:flagellar basal-body rod protein FlgG
LSHFGGLDIIPAVASNPLAYRQSQMNPSKPICLIGAALIVVVGLFYAGRGPGAEHRTSIAESLVDSTDNAPEKTNRSREPRASQRELRHSEPRDVLQSALANYQSALAVVANNVANAETSGFKASRVIWEENDYRQDLAAGEEDSSGNRSPNSCSIGSGSRIAAVQIDFSQGRLKHTGSDLDLAIDGEGFFQVNDPSTCSTCYCRGGRFAINENGQLVISAASSGRLLEPAITIPSDTIAIFVSEEGLVTVQQAGGLERSAVGQIVLASFMNPHGLQRLGENLFAQTSGSGSASNGSPDSGRFGKIRQGWAESSNVDLAREVGE